MNANDFNKKYPVNSKFKYYPVKGCEDWMPVRTRSKAWESASGEVVVKLEDWPSKFGKVSPRSGCYSIDHLEPITDD